MRTFIRQGVVLAGLVAAATVAVIASVVRRTPRPRRPSGGPLVVFFHGKGGRDSTYEAILDPLGVDYILPHGYSVGGNRHEWWPMGSQTEDQEQYAEDVEEAVLSVLPQMQQLAASGRPIILAGHSQGGQLAASLAMRGVAPAVVASAWVPEPLRTTTPAQIVFVHGTEDPYAPLARTQQMVEELSDGGADVTFVPVQGVGHTFTGALRNAWETELNDALVHAPESE